MATGEKLKQSDQEIQPLSPEFQISPLSIQLDAAVSTVKLPKGFSLTRVTNINDRVNMSQAGLGHDYRTREVDSEGVASTFKGVDFNPRKITTQEFMLCKEGKPIGVITMAITPQWANEQNRYFQVEDTGNKKQIVVQDIAFITKTGVPDFLIIPAWVEKVLDARNDKGTAIALAEAMTAMTDVCAANAPEGKQTRIEIVTDGLIPKNSQKHAQLLAFGNPSGTVLTDKDLGPIDKDLLGKPAPQSRWTVRLAESMRNKGMELVPGIASALSGGAVYISPPIKHNQDII